MSYDTTFKCGDFYVSPLLIRFAMFIGDPGFPFAYLYHDSKTEVTHTTFMTYIYKVCPLLKEKAVFATDGEKAIRNSITKVFDNEPYRCWNHIFTNIDGWVKKHAGKMVDCTFYKAQVKELFHLESQEAYQIALVEKQSLWDPTFVEYFDLHIGCDIHRIARWVLEKVGLYDPYSGITQNYSEGVNNLLHIVAEYKELPIDVCILVFQQLSISFWNEIMKGFSLEGNYSLKNIFLRYKRQKDETILRHCVTPGEVADFINQMIDLNNVSGKYIPNDADNEEDGLNREKPTKPTDTISSQEMRARMLLNTLGSIVFKKFKNPKIQKY